MKDVVYTLEFFDDDAASRSNDYLKKGWLLLHVGTKSLDYNDGIAYYSTVYVVGANQEQYDQYKVEQSKNTDLESFISDLENDV